MISVFVYQACGCCAVCRAPTPGDGEDVKEINGWFTCEHNADMEPGMKTFTLIGRQWLTGAYIYKEVATAMIQ